MGVAVLNPQDCLKDTSFSRQPLISLPPKSKPPSRNPNRSVRAQPNRRKRSPPRSDHQSPPFRQPHHVRILKRGEVIASPAPIHESETSKLQNPDLGTTRTEIAEPSNKVALFYAGSAFFTSPPPSSVPLPAFFTKKVAVDDATSGLRRLLRLD